MNSTVLAVRARIVWRPKNLSAITERLAEFDRLLPPWPGPCSSAAGT